MNKLIDTYKKIGDFSHDQKVESFVNPSQEILDMILNSDDFNFNKKLVCVPLLITV